MTTTRLRTLRLGTRGSALARTQSGLVADALTAHGFAVDLVEITTQGDTDRRALAQIGGTGVFAAALRQALALGEVELAVHSLKDLPAVQPPDLVIAAVPPREDPADVLVGSSLAALRPGARVGTGSPRRAAQLAAIRSDLHLVEVRGNVDTRLAAVESGRLDAVVLARAGLARLGRLDAVAEVLDLLPAPGQGALAVECRPELASSLAVLDDPASRVAVTAERAVLVGLAAGCSTPIGARAERVGTGWRLRAVVGADLRVERTTSDLDLAGAERLGHDVAHDLLARGAGAYLKEHDPMGQH
ncbi:MAG TPA: hydroxymethylbilane synthase [Mycobacteriales bacterium]